MSDKAIELFIRMHLERAPELQRGRPILTGDVIIAVLGVIQYQHPLGCDLMMARWLNDSYAVRRVGQYLDDYVNESSTARPDILRQLSSIAFMIFLGRPTEDQIRKLASLWQKHSAQAKRSRRLVKQYETHIALLNNRLLTVMTDFRVWEINNEISRYEQLINREESRLCLWASEQAQKSCQCPKCHGCGRSAKAVCSACSGVGSFMPNAGNAFKYLRTKGIHVSEKLWHSDLKPAFDGILSMLYREHDEAARLLDKRLKKESFNYIVNKSI
ncbi:TIGR02642 family protein [Vibrio spartinae]|uniref:Uncharacterized protein n=1 Tax=Vibrio spartinae TaxID=1918945 RepID=A0A1N6M9G6_9VIBR|nr:TIGR02642 family protein [Vibrio spartinae]SIO96108.1 hypothetical protein VSP9026_03868 [Vibrio spartinae]